MRRIVITGAPGAGKTTLAARVATALDMPHIELDALHHLPDWQDRPVDEFRSLVDAATAGDGWVVCGNYRRVGDLVWDRADTVVLLDLPRWRVQARLWRRTLRRTVTREELWNGNRERFRNLFSPVPEENVIVWSWIHHHAYVARFDDAVTDPTQSATSFVRLSTPTAIEAWARATR